MLQTNFYSGKLLGACALALIMAGCSSSGGSSNRVTEHQEEDRNGDVDSFETVAGGLAASAENTAGGIVMSGSSGDAVTANLSYDGDLDQTTLAFTGGSLDGRTITFQMDDNIDGYVEGEVISGLQGDETEGNLTALFADDKAAFAAIVMLDEGDWDNELELGQKAQLYALYGNNPAHDTHTLPDANAQLTYSGGLVGAAADGSNTGLVLGGVSISADFGTGDVTGSVSGLTFEESGDAFAGGAIGFEATMSTDRAAYSGDTITVGGAAATGAVEGGFYGIEAAETAGAIYAEQDANVLVGAFRADKD